MLSSTHLRILSVALLITGGMLPARGIAQAQSACSDAFRDSLGMRTLRAFDRVAAVPPVWDNYEFRRHALLLLADSAFRGQPATPVCAGIWKAGAPLEIIELSERPSFSTPLYGMIDIDPIGPAAVKGAADLAVVSRPAPPGVVAALRRHGIARTVVLNVPLNFGGMGKLGDMLIATKADAARIQADLAVHESFHLHSQFPTWLDQSRTYAWPAWDIQPDRAAIRQRCYAGSPELSSALRKELDALVAAYDAVSLDSAKRDVELGLRHARRALELRVERRKLQDTMSVAQAGRRVSCGVAEDLMEMEEGASQWIGHATSRSAALIGGATLRGTYAGSQPEVFYQTGPLQLWVLDGLIGHDALRRLTSAMTRSRSIESGSVHAQFERQIQQMSGRRTPGFP